MIETQDPSDQSGIFAANNARRLIIKSRFQDNNDGRGSTKGVGGKKSRAGRLPFASAEAISGVLASRHTKRARQKTATVKTSNLYSLAASERYCVGSMAFYIGLACQRDEFLRDISFDFRSTLLLGPTLCFTNSFSFFSVSFAYFYAYFSSIVRDNRFFHSVNLIERIVRC